MANSIIQKYRDRTPLFVGDKVVFYENDIMKTIRLATVTSMHIDMDGMIWYFLEWFENGGAVGSKVEHKHLCLTAVKDMINKGTLEKLNGEEK